jgi:hypothetical protein
MRAVAFDRSSHRVVAAAAVVVLFAIPSTAARVAAAFLAVGILPGLAVAPRNSRGAAFGVGTALSPVIFGALTLLALLAGLDMGTAARVGVVAGLILFVALGGSSAPEEATAANRRTTVLVGLVIAVAAVMALALPLTDTWWRWREDSWFHAAVADKLTRDGLPLTDPYFAGLRLQYPYCYHAILSACASLTGIDFFHAMILVNAIALTSCTLAFHALSGLFSRRTGPRVLGLCVWLFAMNGWFYLFYPLRLARGLAGESHGLEVLRRFFPWTPAGHATAVNLVSVEGNQFMFLDKFMVGTAFSLTLGLAASLLFLLLSARRGAWSRRHDAAFTLCVAGTLALHVVTGVTLAFATTLVLALLVMIRAQPSRGGPAYARLLAWVALGVAVTIPYLRSVASRGGGVPAVGVAFQPAYAVGLLADILPAFVLALFFFRRSSEHRDTPAVLGARPFTELSLSATGMLALWTLWVMVGSLTVDLTTNNETKFAFLLQLPLSALAVGAFERLWSNPRARRAALGVVASATLPLHLLYYHHAVRDSSTAVVSEPERAAYAWMRADTPRDAVFLEEDDIVRVPVLASRDLYWGTGTYARNWGYPVDEMTARQRLRDGVFSAAGPSADDLARLRSLRRRVFVVYRMHGEDRVAAPGRFDDHADRFRRVFATDAIAVWELFLE